MLAPNGKPVLRQVRLGRVDGDRVEVLSGLMAGEPVVADVLIPFPRAAVRDVEQMVAGPAEQVLAQITGVEHVMSVSRKQGATP